jgi:hypothetical protein
MYPHPDIRTDLGRERMQELRRDGAQPSISPADPRRFRLLLLRGRLFGRRQPRVAEAPAPSRS